MAAIVETSDQIVATPAAAAEPARGRFIRWWPGAMIVFALVLTLCWNAGLLLVVWWVI
jgi:hypothetical protein